MMFQYKSLYVSRAKLALWIMCRQPFSFICRNNVPYRIISYRMELKIQRTAVSLAHFCYGGIVLSSLCFFRRGQIKGKRFPSHDPCGHIFSWEDTFNPFQSFIWNYYFTELHRLIQRFDTKVWTRTDDTVLSYNLNELILNHFFRCCCESRDQRRKRIRWVGPSK